MVPEPSVKSSLSGSYSPSLAAFGELPNMVLMRSILKTPKRSPRSRRSGCCSSAVLLKHPEVSDEKGKDKTGGLYHLCDIWTSPPCQDSPVASRYVLCIP